MCIYIYICIPPGLSLMFVIGLRFDCTIIRFNAGLKLNGSRTLWWTSFSWRFMPTNHFSVVPHEKNCHVKNYEMTMVFPCVYPNVYINQWSLRSLLKRAAQISAMGFMYGYIPLDRYTHIDTFQTLRHANTSPHLKLFCGTNSSQSKHALPILFSWWVGLLICLCD